MVGEGGRLGGGEADCCPWDSTSPGAAQLAGPTPRHRKVSLAGGESPECGTGGAGHSLARPLSLSCLHPGPTTDLGQVSTDCCS